MMSRRTRATSRPSSTPSTSSARWVRALRTLTAPGWATSCSKIGTQEAGQRGAITSNYAARGGGQGGMGGTELAAQLQNQQGAADRAAGMGRDVVAQGGQRAL